MSPTFVLAIATLVRVCDAGSERSIGNLSFWVDHFSTDTNATMLTTCKKTAEEADVAEYVNTRNQRVRDGTIKKQIESGTYTADSLSSDLYMWWVQRGLANHGIAIQQFVDLMQRAKEKAAKKDWLSIVTSWLGLLLDVLSPLIKEGAELIKTGLQAVKEGLSTYGTLAGDESSGDFLKAAMNWRGKLPTQRTTSLLMIDKLVNAVRNVPKAKQTDGILQGYNAATKLIAASQSLRTIFNSYYLTYLTSVYSGKPFPFTFTSSNIERKRPSQLAIWTPTPSGLDPCTVADYVYKLNEKCIKRGSSTNSLSTLGFKVQLDMQGIGQGLGFDCSNLALEDYEGCWFQQKWYKKSVGTCVSMFHQLKQIAGTRWPTPEAKSFCRDGFTSSFSACNSGSREILCNAVNPQRKC